jgi:translation initiation factor IF-2
MAKVRVYELARELELESKDLVEKLLAGGMSIKNYMSTLDDEAVTRAKEVVSGAISEVIEEKRIKSTVIRRRRKKIRIEPEVPAIEVEAEEEKAEALEPELPAEDVTRPEEPPEKKPPGKEKEPVPEKGKKAGRRKEKPNQEAPAEKVAKPKKAKKKKVEKAAKIIKRPEEGPLKDILARKAEKKAPAAKKQKPAEPTLEALKFAKVEKVEVEPEKVKPKPGKKKKFKKQKEDQGTIPKGAFRRKKKEIYEKADLYQGRGPRRKGKKGGKAAKDVAKKLKHTEITVPKAIKRRIKIQESVTVADLAKAMGIKAAEMIKRLLGFGATFSINQSMDFETASVVADDLGYELELDSFEEESLISETTDKPEDLKPRPPVVTIMGHVDHGKTSLLDYIRQSNIIGRESGGITQHIGAYYVNTDGGDIVFLDTPGHEAFTAMRARGSEVTDLIVLVVAADDGVMPQTKEAVNHGRAANIPIVVAVNKMDKPEADPEKVKRELAELDLAPEDWGGETIFGHISAKTGEGVDDLLGLILLQAEVLELKGNPNKLARGTVIEARLDKSKGPVATVLIKAGTLSKGVYFVCGQHYGRVRDMNDHRGRKMKSAGPSVPVEIYGISGVPMAGDEVVVVEDEKIAKQVIEYRKAKSRKQKVVKRDLVSLDDLYDRIKEGDVKELNIVLKADVQGSLEALSEIRPRAPLRSRILCWLRHQAQLLSVST